ncbi:MAG: hypothetical protein HY823_03250 [Acidobacteria bacterium]|nr:hypothetical protein [Acidobacteriota bacterium]
MTTSRAVAKNLGLRVFLGLWIILFSVALVAIVMPAKNSALRLNGLGVVSAIVVPVVIPAAILGRALGAKIQALGYFRTIGYQAIAGILWACLSAIWMFIVVFHEKLGATLFSKPNAMNLGHIFLEGFPFVATLLGIILLPSTLIASGVLALIFRKKNLSSPGPA